MSRVQTVSRRGFLGGIFSAGAVIVGVRVLPEALLAAPTADTAAWHPSVYLGLEPDGTVIIVAHRSEMGTGIRTVLPTVVADEMEADWKRVKIEQALGNQKYGSQNTDGSCSIRDFYDAMREAGASARMLLERAAAKKWNVPESECKANQHFVTHAKSGNKLGYGELVAIAATLPLPKKEELKFKSPADFKYVGKSLQIADLSDMTNGKAIFGMDAAIPGMLYASIEHPPVLGAKLKSVDDSAAKAVKGVAGVFTLDTVTPPVLFKPLGGVAVLADNTWTAMQARKKLKLEWESGANAIFESGAYRQKMIDLSRQPQKVARKSGDVDAAFQGAKKVLEAQYYTPLLSHVPMEPPVALADYKDGKVEAWTCTQNPQEVQTTVAAALGIKPEAVTCHVTLLGGGFGRKSKPDYVAEAALLSKKAGKPVKVVWSREDDIKFDYFHSTAAMYMKAALDEKGLPSAWLQRSVFPPIASIFNPAAPAAFELGMGWTDVPFDIPNFQAENALVPAHVRIGWMRSVGNVYHAFAVHSFLDELADAAGQDRIHYFLKTLGSDRILFAKPGDQKGAKPGQSFDTARLRRVVELVAEKSNWAKYKPAKGRALGFAAHRSFLTYVATVVEVEVDSAGKLHIPQVHMAIDCGQVMNEDRVKSQFEGAAVFGTSLAMMGEITAADGRIVQGNFNNFPVARINEAPKMTHVHIVKSTLDPTGVGEPGVPPIAPAICNAIYAATGKRIRELPVKKTKLV